MTVARYLPQPHVYAHHLAPRVEAVLLGAKWCDAAHLSWRWCIPCLSWKHVFGWRNKSIPAQGLICSFPSRRLSLLYVASPMSNQLTAHLVALVCFIKLLTFNFYFSRLRLNWQQITIANTWQRKNFSGCPSTPLRCSIPESMEPRWDKRTNWWTKQEYYMMCTN